MLTDRDPQAVADARARFGADGRVTIRQVNFAELGAWVNELGLDGKIDGLLLDIGVSSPQLDDAWRGFSFMADGPLDMRMDPGSGEPVLALLARADVADIAMVIREFCVERFSRRMAWDIVRMRQDSILG